MAFGDTIAQTVLGKPTTPQDTDNNPNTIAEGAAVNTTVGITAQSTFANGSADVDYSLSADSSGGGFKIDPVTGVVTVADPSKIDFESAPGHAYSITVLATKNNNFSSEQTFTINVTDVAPSAPVDSNPAANTVLEGAAIGTAAGITASSTDVNGGAVTYSLTGDTSGGGFTINPTTGVVTVADGSKIDFESAPGHAYTVTVQSSDGTLTNSQAFTINVGDVAMSTPVDNDGAANSVAEGAANGTAVGITASAGDPNGPATTYALTNNAGGRFAINSTTGVVTVANGAAIDFETAPGHAYGITVQATSGAQTTSQAFSIGVTDVGPSTPADGNGAANTVFELAANGTLVGITASSTDPGGGPAPTYALTDSAGGRFAINATTGVVSVANGAAIDFETAPGHAYNITVQSTAGALSSTQTFSIGVGNVNEAPAGTDKTVVSAEDTPYTFSVADFGFSDPSDSSAPNSLQAVKIATLPGAGAGTLKNNGGTVNAGDFISATDIAAGHLVFTPVSNANGSPLGTFTFQVQDNGGTANGGVDLDQSPNTLTINITAVNDAPVNSVPGTQSVNEDATLTFSSGNGNAITISDVDVGAGNETVTLTVTSGTLALGSTAGLASFTNNAASITLTGTVANINAAMNGLTYHGNLNFNGTDTLVVSTNDNGNTGSGGAKTDTDNVTINVTSVNDAPAGTDKTVTMLEGDSYAFSVADFGFTDPNDSSAPNSLLSVKMTTVPGAGTGTFTNNGVTVNAGDSVSAANIAAGLLVFTPTAHSNGSPEATFTFQVRDNGGTANGGVDLDQSPNTMTINVNAVNDAPINSVPGTQSLNEEGSLVFSSGNGNAITISDIDVGSGNETVTLTVTGGTLALGSTAGLASFTNNAASITLTGTVANVNAAMNGLTYTGNLNFAGADSLVVSTNDNGNTGAGGPKIDTDSITINVAPVNDAPVNGVPGTQTVNEDTNLVFTGANAISISDVDANGGNETVTLSVASGALTLSGVAGLSFTVGDGTADATMTFSGTVAAINTALNGLIYRGNLNFNGSDTLSITTNDGGNTGSGGALQDVDSVTINVTAVNDAPVVTAGHTLNYTENQAATAIDPAITVSDVDSANLASATVQITGNYVNGEDVLGFTNQNGITGSFNAATGTLTLTGSSSVANYQTALASVTYVNTSDNPSGAARTVTIITNDGAANSIAVTDTINVTPVNDAPVVTAGHTLNYTENQAATAIDPAIAVSDVDSANLASATVQITGNYVNGEDVLGFTNQNGITGSFNAATGTLTLTGSSSVANYQTALASVTYVNTSDNPSGLARTVTIITNDGSASSVAKTDTINVTPVNDAPVATAGHTLAYTENDPATAIDAAFTVSDVDSANLASATVQITGNYVNGQDVLSFTNQNGITGSFNAATGTLTLTGSSSVANYQTALDSVKYSNTSDDPSTASRTVTIITNDGSANSVAVTDTITVAAVNDAPTLTATGNNPNYSNGVDLFSSVTASTVEAGQSLDQLKLTVTNISGTAADSLTIDGTTVELTNGNVVSTSTPGVTATVAVAGSTATVTIDSTPGLSNAAMSALIDGLSYTDTNVTPGDPARVVTITQLHDTGGTSPGVDTAVLSITSTVFFDQAPVVTAGHTLNYTENQAATALDTAITVTDADNANLASATVQITGNYVNGEDVLGFTNQNGITGSFNAATGTLTLTGTSSVANYQTALASVTYVNTSENPSGLARTVTITANDGFVNSTPVTDTINVTPVNDPPVVTAGHTLSYTEDQAATAIDPAITVSDVDNANLASATVQITGNYASGQDVLGFTDQNGITGSFNAGTGTLTLTGSSSVANYQTALASVTYVNTSQNPSGLTRTVTIITNDGAANSVAKTDTINVTPVNDAPVTTAGGTLNYTENQAATAIDASVTVSDVDNTNLSSATVQITAGYVNGEDILGFTTQNGITGVFNAATGTMTLSGSSSVANYQTALRSVTYFDNSDNPSGADRTVTYIANDGTANSNSSTSTIHVTPVNDAPVVTATGTLAYTENQAPTAIAPALTVTDVDTATLTTATVQISNNYVNGEDVLGFTNTANITGSFNAATGTMTLTGTDTVANYQAALRTVTYVDNSENPSTSARTVTFKADDGQAANHLSAGSDHSITVASVDDAPVNNGVPANFIVGSGFSHTVTGLSITDVDAGSFNDITTTFTAGAGTVKIGDGTSGGNAGISSGATVTTNSSGTVVLTGTVAQINTSLSGNNVVYTAADNAGNTTTTLQMATNDHGHTGSGGPITDTDTINIGVIPQVWFIDQAQVISDATATRGSQANPFSTVDEFNASSGPGVNDYIYVKAGTYSGEGINLKAGQTLLGDDQALSFTNPLNPGGPAIQIEDATGARPTISVAAAHATDQGIALASGNTVAGIIVTTNASGQIGIDDSGASVGTLNISDSDVTGSGQAINITHGGTGGSMVFGTVSSSGGTNGIALGGALVTSFSATTGTLSGHSGSEFSSVGGSGNVSYGGAIGDGTGFSATINNRSGGTVTLSGNINDSNDAGGGIGISGNDDTTINFTGTTKTLNTGIGDGVSMTGNTGTSNVNFTGGGLDIDTTNGTGFIATGVSAGTYTVTGSGNSITTTGTGGIINMSGVSLGAGGVTFGSLQSTGASVNNTAILLNDVDGNTFTSGGTSIAGTSGAGNDGIRISGGSSSTFNFNGTTTVSNTANDGINLSGANGAVTFNSVAINGMGGAGSTGDGIDISGNTNAVTISGGSIGNTNDPAGAGVKIGNGNGDVSVAASITKTTAGNVVDVTGHTGGTIGFSGAISATGGFDNGINLANNTGGTITFSNATKTLNTGANNAVDFTNSAATGAAVTFSGGGLDIDTTSGKGINATSTVAGAGSLTITGSNNSITSTAASALTVDHVNIGGSGLTFQSINAGTGANTAGSGILLSATGSAGGLTVTGTGSAGTGGTIQHFTNGIFASDTDNLSLSWMNFTANGQNQTQAGSSTTVDGNLRTGNNLSAVANINLRDNNSVTLDHVAVTNSAQIGINGNNVNGFTLSHSTVTGNGNEAFEGGLVFQNLLGTDTISDTIIKDNAARQIHISNTADNSTLNLSITGTRTNNAYPTQDTSTTVIGNTTANPASTTTQQGILFETNTTGSNINMGLTVSGVAFNNNIPQNALDIQHLSASGTLTGSVTNSSFDTNAGGVIISMQNGSAAQTSSFNITNNEFNRTALQSILVAGANAYNGNITSIITGNTIGTSGQAGSAVYPTSGANANGIEVNMIGGSGSIATRIQSNTIQQFDNTGISERINGAGTMTSIVDSNTIREPFGSAPVGMNFNVGTSAGATAIGTFQITNNAIQGTYPDVGGGPEGLLTNVRFNATFKLPGYAGGGTDLTAVANYIAANNPGIVGGTGNMIIQRSSPGVYAGGAALVSPLYAAEGGVQALSPTAGETHLTQPQLDSVVAAAIAQWAHAGASAAQLAALYATTFSVADLSGVTIGEEGPTGHIIIDIDAAGHGWFVDPTPGDNSEFTHARNAAGTDLLSDPASAAAGHIDLLTTVAHEMGHVLGLDDVPSPADDLMYVNLVDGERRVPDAADVAKVNAADATAAEAALPLSAQAPDGTPIVAGTAGNDTIDAGHGGSILFGGAGADNFVFGPNTPLNAPTPAQITHVADYHAAQGDTFDFSAITSTFHNSSLSDALVVRAVEDASGKFAMLQVDHIDATALPGAPNWVNVAQLDGAHAGDAVNVLIDNHSLHMAHIHVDLLV